MLKLLLLLTTTLFIGSQLVAQVCTINYGVSGTGIYPDSLPDGTVGQSYSTDVTFVMPLDTMGYDFTNFKILAVSLPAGLSWECSNNTNSCNYNPQVSQYGCVNIYGTPLLAGVYNIDVTVIADLTVIQGYPFNFQIYMEVLPSSTTTTNTGFSMLGSSGCMPLTVDFTNNNPGLVAYSWDFGNGNTSTAENPAPQIYTTPGDYVVHYEAYNNTSVVDIYTLTNVGITAMSNYGGGFPSYESADPYFILKENGTAIYQSAFILDTDPPVSWPTSILLNPLNTYVVEIWEADETAAELFFGADDYMGSHTLNLAGCSGCSAGTSTINYTINHQVVNPSPVVISADTVHVYDFPAVPVISFDPLTQTMSTPDLGLVYQWYLNGTIIAGAISNSYVISQSGNYSVAAITLQGCSASSLYLPATYCDLSIDPVISAGANGFLFVTGFPANYDVEWSLNNTIIPGQSNDTLYTSQAGDYLVTVTSPEGCTYTTDIFSTNLGVEDNTLLNWSIFPNPAKDAVTVALNNDQTMDEIQLIDVTGRVIRTWKWQNSSSMTVNIQDIPSGYFILQLVNGSQSWVKRFIIE